jgi:3D (Asp-Asp-Asp) domain-containing protein
LVASTDADVSGSNVVITAHDAAGNQTVSTTASTVAIDTHGPIGSALDSVTAQITNKADVFTVSLSEALSRDLTLADFAASNNASISALTKIDSTHYQVTVTPNTGVVSGTMTLSFVSGLHDAAGNLMATSISGASQGIDTVAPTLAMPTSTSSQYLNNFWNAQLLSDGEHIKLKFSETLDSVAAQSSGNNFTVSVPGYNVQVKSVLIDPQDSTVVILTLGEVITQGLTTSVEYKHPGTGDVSTAVLQDIAGNDQLSGVWALNDPNSQVVGSTITVGSAAQADVQVYEGGLVFGTSTASSATVTLTHSVAGNEFLTGGSADNTVVIASGGNNDSAANWYLSGYNVEANSSWFDGVDGSSGYLSGTSAVVNSGGEVFGFYNIGNSSDMVYAQAGTIVVGSTHFVLDGNVLQITDSNSQTINIDPEVISAGTSLAIGIGSGGDTLIDSTSSIYRTDTAVYSAGFHSDFGSLINSDLINKIESVVTYDTTNPNTFDIHGSSATDKLSGIEQVQFETADGQVNVAFIGTMKADGVGAINGYGSATLAHANNADAEVIVVSNPLMKGLDHSSVVSMIDGMISSNVDGHLLLNLNPTVRNSMASEFLNTSKVIFETNDPTHPVTVLVVGKEGYTSIDAAMDAAHSGDVIYLSDSATLPANYTVYKQDMVFMANGDNAKGLTLTMGYFSTADHSLEIHNLTLMGTADMNVVGNQLDNVIIGNHGSNTIHGMNGNDVIDAGGGADQLFGDGGNDTLIVQSGKVGSSTLISGGAGDDTLIDATTDGSAVNMTGGSGKDTFMVGSLSSDNGSVHINALITDLSQRSGDVLDFSHLVNASGTAITAGNAVASSLTSTYSGGDMVYNFGSGVNTVSDHANADGTLTATQVNLTGTLDVYMTTASNATSALVYANSTQPVQSPTLGHTVAQDIYSQASVASELTTLVPLLEHNHLG